MTRIITWLSTALMFSGTVIFPLGYFLITYQNTSGSLETEAEIKANTITQIISSNPLMWEFEQMRIEELIAQQKKGALPESRFVYNTRNELIVKNEVPLKSPVIMKSAKLFDSGKVVGRIEIVRSLYPVVMRAGIITAIVLPVWLGGFLFLRITFLRAIRSSEVALRASEKKYRGIVESANDAIFTLDPDFNFIDVNKKAVEIFGYSKEEFLRMKILDVISPDQVPALKEKFGELSSRGSYKNFTGKMRAKDGSWLDIEINSSAIFENGKVTGSTDIVRNITERMQMEEALKKSEERYAEAAGVAHLGHWERDLVNLKGFWSKEMYSIFGVDPESFEPTVDNFLALVHPDDRQKLKDTIFSTASCNWPLSLEYRIIRSDGEERFVRARMLTICNDKGESTRLIGTVQDVTEHKRIEEALQRVEQMKLIGEWATGLSEGIKNSLAGIKTSIELLNKEYDISEEDRIILSKSIDEVARIELTINSLLKFVTQSEPQLMTVNINDLLDKTIEFSLKHACPSSRAVEVKIIKGFDGMVPEIMADPFQLQQAFLNLIINAVDAMPTGGELVFRTFYQPDTHSIEVTVSDTGTGIAGKMKDRIFKPFFTTKSKGTGLGLAVTKKLIEQHHGEIHLEKTSDRGTTFSIRLPVPLSPTSRKSSPAAPG